ncbi:GNAT family N-acetyltransferase [Rhodobacter ferrooxidans]|uniref:GCN5-related N-acetyltransferase n=1 Tax=Rhodobacter ferrooxidans TaxID=371731 RepID=C8RZN8_9RHOB|nr:GNAT family N-acetyltransferase [Rhodobacter sp. SW2]EEW25835.1 GCN5-related N-acetyltransferase [Rhodobacter sp. SW2]
MTRFAGSAAEAAVFVNRCWAARFSRSESCPQWDAAFFDWQVFSRPDSLRIAAYAGGDLAGLVFSLPTEVVLNGDPLRLAQASWLSVAPEMARRGVAKALAAEMARQEAAAGCAFMFGYAVPGKGSHGPRFWQGKVAAARRPGLRPWVRALDAGVLRRSVGAVSERLAAALAAALRLDRCGAVAAAVRPCRVGDLAACGALLRAADAEAAFRYDWSDDHLARQLQGGGFPTTLVFDDGGLQGFASFHRVGFRGRQEFSAGLIDHLVTRPGAKGVGSALLGAALAAMQQQGLALAVCTDAAGVSPALLLRHGFAPMPERYDLLFIGAEVALPQAGGIRVHLR